jgi:glutamyl-Q tRNA(Asp) synthetase
LVLTSSTRSAVDVFDDNVPDISSPYIGRFAPSPTGPLHFGSLLAALASYLDARHHHGQWLIRIEDIDPPREIPSAKERILEALDAHQLISDKPIVYQSQRQNLYQNALDQLIEHDRVFPCTCSRTQLKSSHGIHFGNCHSQLHDSSMQTKSHEFAWRFDCQSITTTQNITIEDKLQGLFSQSLQQDVGDFVIKRKDKLWAYQLAMVVDDYQQKITHVVRGIDLIDSTLKQNMLQRALDYPIPHYSHIPIACANNGQKLSKQNKAPALDLLHPKENLWQALIWLKQNPPQSLRHENMSNILSWAISHWQPLRLKNIQRQSVI